MMDKLKPCPFCGSTNISSNEVAGKHPNEDRYFYQTSCLDCGANGPESKTKDLTGYNDAADKAWNTRTHVSVPVEPTEEMLKHGFVEYMKVQGTILNKDFMRNVYKAMLSKA